jgi:hypothetical protein
MCIALKFWKRVAVVLFVGATAFFFVDAVHASMTQDVEPALSQAWAEASQYADSRKEAWNEIWTAFDVPADVAEAIVFPEMLRYSIWQDQLETSAVKGTYVSLGSQGFDFSIGRFQMKPSFVERLERRWMKSAFPSQFEAYFDTDNTRMARRVRLIRIEDEIWQCVYVAMFIKLTYLDYQGLLDLPIKEQVRLVATAYNHGAISNTSGGGSIAILRQWANKRFFHLDLLPTKDVQRYVYADLAIQRFEEVKKQQKNDD